MARRLGLSHGSFNCSAPHTTLSSIQSRLTLCLLTSLGATGCSTRAFAEREAALQGQSWRRRCFVGVHPSVSLQRVARRSDDSVLRSSVLLASSCADQLSSAHGRETASTERANLSRTSPARMAQGPHGAQRSPPEGCPHRSCSP